MKAKRNLRLSAIPGLGPEELSQLQGSRVGIIGAGVLGGQLSYHLGLLGVAQVIVDRGLVRAENLANQGFPVATEGQAKSLVRAQQIHAINPDCQVTPVVKAVEGLGFGSLRRLALVATGLDSRRARLSVNERAFRLGIPWVDSAVDGTGRNLLGTVTAYDPQSPDSPCYMCRHDRSDLESISKGEQSIGCPSWRRSEDAITQPTLQASAFAAIVAGFQALWVTRMLLGARQELAGRQLIIQGGHKPEIKLVKLSRNHNCLFDHFQLNPLKQFTGKTVGELLTRACQELADEPEELVFHEVNVITCLQCRACGATRDLLRAAVALSDQEVRCQCQSELEMLPLGLSTALHGAELQKASGHSWSEVGLAQDSVVTATRGLSQVHYLVNPPSGAVQKSPY